jgi:VWFA-related protein
MIGTRAVADREIASMVRFFAGWMFGLALVCGVRAVAATVQDESATKATVATLRVETNLVQIPVLILDKDRERLRSQIAASRVAIRLGDGPWVQPKYVRLEGDDPIDLAIVIDPRGAQIDVLPKLSKAIAGLAPSSLSSRDRVSIYMMGCSVMHVAKNIPVDPDSLRSATETVLENWRNHAGEESMARCKPGTQIWDTLAYVARAMSDRPGRRAILAITDGDDQHSEHSVEDAGEGARADGVAVFALDPAPAASWMRTREQERLSAMTESTGGITWNAAGQSVDKQLQRFVATLRSRYIVEFSRPSVAKAGKVHLDVRVAGSDYFIRAGSKSVPLPDLAEGGGPRMTSVPSVEQGSEDITHSPHVAAASSDEVPAPASHAQTAVQVAPGPPSPGAAATSDSNRDEPETAAAAIAPVVASQSADSASPVPTLHVVSKLTIENVTVTDARRIPVHGLTKAEFELKEDGKPQTIRNFEEFDGGRRSTQAASPALAADTFTNAAPATPDGGAVNILMLDSVTTGLARGLAMAPDNFQYARTESMNYLKNLPSGTAVAILQMGNGVRVLEEATQDKRLLLAAMKAARYTPVIGAYTISGGACVAANTQSQLVVNDLDQVAAYLTGIKGRKNLVWFTPGTPWLTQYPAFSASDCLRDYTSQLDKAYSLLNAAQVALYPIDPRGLVGDESYSARGSRMGSSAAFGMSLMTDESSLGALAEATGGTAYYSRNDLDAAVREAIATGADYYSLAYVPPVSKYDGKFHTISVKVSRPNLVLTYRPGYTSVDLAKIPAAPGGKSTAPAQDSFLGTMGHGTVNSTGLQFEVHVTPSSAAAKPGDSQIIGSLSPSLAGKHLVRYDFVYDFAGDEITLVDNPKGGKSGSLEFILAAYDADGKLLNTVGQTSKFTVTPENVAGFMKRQIQIPVQFDLPAGNVFVRVGLKDVSSDKTGTLEIAEDVAKK